MKHDRNAQEEWVKKQEITYQKALADLEKFKKDFKEGSSPVGETGGSGGSGSTGGGDIAESRGSQLAKLDEAWKAEESLGPENGARDN